MNSSTDNTQFKTALAVCQMMLRQRADRSGPFLKSADILAVVEEITAMPTMAAVDKDRLTKELEERFTVMTDDHRTLGNDDDHKAWLPARRANIAWRYWDRYRLFIEESLPGSAVDSIDSITNDVLERIEDPERPGNWDRRGLVMGHVQSGKTANYTGLICKAADAGYKVIIVLAGIHNSLRSQTQIRIDEGFLGFMSESEKESNQSFKRTGVGLLDSSILANTGTNRTEFGDFNEAVAKKFGIHPGGLPLVFVVKKNAGKDRGVLNNLIRWINSAADAQDPISGAKYVRNVPALIIDDESDLASVDTKAQAFDEDGNPDEDHNPAETNAAIRRLLKAFEKVAYVGYTATPFANIYIHDKGFTRKLGDDLFPRSFIVNIPPPSNYMGPARIFGITEDEDAGLEQVQALPIITTVSDHAASDKVDETSGWMPPKLTARTGHIPKYQGKQAIPPELHRALMSYILATVVRHVREEGPIFNSMLVHVVRYTAVQKKVAAQIEVALNEINQRLRNGDGKRVPTIRDEFRSLWELEFLPKIAECSRIVGNKYLYAPAWKDLSNQLEGVAKGIKIKIINGSAGDVLDYEEHKKTGIDIIAVGGDKLSRGLTLEGLTVTYFLRASRMYDTLMQMGRWFGYKEKYIDVCRLYTTPELVTWFAHIAAASAELQNEFDEMVSVGATPKAYGIRVRSHPVMLVTSAVKMRHGTEMKLSFSGDVSETILFDNDKVWLGENATTVADWLSTLGPQVEGGKIGGYTWGTDSSKILEFLSRYKSHEDARRADTGLLIKYIQKQLEQKPSELGNWTVRLVSSGQARPEQSRMINGLEVGLVVRARFPAEQDKKRYTIRRLVSPADEAVDLSEDETERAIALTVEKWIKSTRRNKPKLPPTQPGGSSIREVRNVCNGLLLIYPLDPQVAGVEDYQGAVMGIAISFPKSATAKEITYTVNNVYTTRGGDDESI